MPGLMTVLLSGALEAVGCCAFVASTGIGFDGDESGDIFRGVDSNVFLTDMAADLMLLVIAE